MLDYKKKNPEMTEKVQNVKSKNWIGENRKIDK